MGEKTKAQLIKELNKLTKQNKTFANKLLKLSKQQETTQTEKLFSAIFENAAIGIALADLNGRFVMINKFFAKLLKYSEKELSSKTFIEVTHPQDIDTSLLLTNELHTNKRTSFKLEKRYIRKDGGFIWAKTTVNVIKDSKGKLKFTLALIEDITSQKEIEKKLETEQNLFNTLMDNVPDSIYFKDLNSRFIQVNKAIAHKKGFKKSEDLLGKTDFDIFDKESAAIRYNDEQEIIRTEKPIIGKEEKEVWPDGRITWASATKLPLYDESGKIIGTFGITRDITQTKENQKMIKESEQLYRSLFENSADGMFFTSEGIILDCNQAVLDIFRCDRDYIIGHSPADFSPEIQPDGRNSLISANEKIESALNGTPQQFYWQHKRPDGTLIDCDISLNAIKIEGNKLIQAIMHDITERKQSERLRQTLYEISEAVNTAEDIDKLYKRIHEIIGELMPVKNFYIALYNEKEDLLTFPYFVDEYDPPQLPKKLGKGLTEYTLRIGEPMLIDAKKDLELREAGEVELIGEPQAIWLGIPLNLSGKTFGVMVVQDYENEKAFGEEEKQLLTFVSEQIALVIERKRDSDAVTKYTEELRQLNITKDKFFSIIAHDLKNPFITILGFSDLLFSDYNDLSDQERLFYVQEMKKSAEVSHNLLQNLLQWSRSQTGRIEFKPNKIDLNDIINQTIELFALTTSGKQINLVNELTPNAFVFADKDMLNTIIRNLIANAIKFTPSGGEIRIFANQNDNFIETCIADTGVGMDQDALQKLFMLDSNISTRGTEDEVGTGLGLILCKEFVEKNGGEIKVESEIGKGSKFIFSLPKSN